MFRTRNLLLLYLLFLRLPVDGKKDIQDYTDREIDQLYEQWDENDEDESKEDEEPLNKRPPIPIPPLDPNVLGHESSTDEYLKLSKKGQSVMMFVSVKSPEGKTTKDFTEKISALWTSNFYNNHIDAQNFVVDDDRILFLFKDGSQAWDARDYLLKRPECAEVSLEGRTQPGLAARSSKQEL